MNSAPDYDNDITQNEWKQWAHLHNCDSSLISPAFSNHETILSDPQSTTKTLQLSIHVKSLVWEYDGCPFLVLLPLSRQVDKSLLASYLGFKSHGIDRTVLASKERTTSLTGYEIGTIPMVGHRTSLRTIVDQSIRFNINVLSKSTHILESESSSSTELINESDLIVCGGSGNLKYNMCLSYVDLLRISHAEVAMISCDQVLVSSSSSIDATTIEDDATLDVMLENINDDGESSDTLIDMSIDMKATSTVCETSINLKSKSNKSSFKPKVSKSKRIDKWNAANKALSMLNNGSPTFSAKLLRDYAWLEESSLFYNIVYLYDMEMSKQITKEDQDKFRCELDTPNSTGKTALHLAAWKGPLGHVKALLHRGAKIDQYSTSPGNYGKSAIFYAITQCRDEVVIELINNGASVKFVNNKGQTPLSLAITHLSEATIQRIELAEKEQSDEQWINFRVSYGDNRMYGDLDPRFVDQVNGSSDNPFLLNLMNTSVSAVTAAAAVNIADNQDSSSDVYMSSTTTATSATISTVTATGTIITDQKGLSSCGRVLYPSTVATRRLLQRRLFERVSNTDSISSNTVTADAPVKVDTGTDCDINDRNAAVDKLSTDTEPLSINDRIIQLQQSTESTFLSSSTAALSIATNHTFSLEGVVVSKRHISKALVFLNIIPTHASSDSDSNQVVNIFDKYAWTLDPSSPTVDSNATNANTTTTATDDKYALQLIIGRTMREAIGEDATVTVCRKLKFGQLVKVLGTVISDSERGSENLEHFQTIDFVVSQLEIVEDDFVQPQLISSSLSLSSSHPLSNSDSVLVISDIGSAVIVEASSTSSDSLITSIDSVIDKSSIKVASIVSLSAQSSAPSFPFIQLNDVFIPNFDDMASALDSNPISKYVTVVNSTDTVQMFHHWIRSLSIRASQQAISAVSGHTSDAVVVGLDCEWRPSVYTEIESDENDTIQNEQRGEQPVATLQLATSDQAFIIDLQVLMSSSISPIISTSSSPTHSNTRQYMSQSQSLLCQALMDLFSHKYITILGYSIGQDLKKLAASYPNFSCFHRFVNVIDVAPLATFILTKNSRSQQSNATNINKSDSSNSLLDSDISPINFPTITKGVTVSLAKLCELLFQRTLDKSQQSSTWHLRPLTSAQILYAALDAAVLPKIFNKLLSMISDTNELSLLWQNQPRWCLNYKYTILHIIGDKIDTSLEYYKHLQKRYQDGTIAETIWIDELEKLSVLNGKVRNELGTILAIQSWSFNTSNSDTKTSSSTSSTNVPSNRRFNKLSLYKEPAAPSLRSMKQSTSSGISYENSSRQRHNTTTDISTSSMDATYTVAMTSLSIDPILLQSFVGLAVGRSKYECIQFCLQSLESVTQPQQQEQEQQSSSIESLDTSNNVTASTTTVKSGTTSIITTGTINTSSGQQSDNVSDYTTTPSAALLQIIRTGVLRRLNDHGGWIELLGSLLLFINCMDEGGVSKAPLQYGNEFLRKGKYFTWFIDTKRWESENGNLAKIIRSTRNNPGNTAKYDNKSVNSGVYLFARQGCMSYLYCGRCRLVLEDAPSSRRNLYQLTFELLDYESTPSSSSSTINSDYLSDIPDTVTNIETTELTSDQSLLRFSSLQYEKNDMNIKRYLSDSVRYKTMVEVHCEEMRQVSAGDKKIVSKDKF